MHSPPPAPPAPLAAQSLVRPRFSWRLVARATLALLALTLSLLLAGWLTLHWGFLQRLDQWRPELEARASRALGVPVRIGRLEASLHGLRLDLALQDLRLLDGTGAPALTLPRVDASLSPRALFGWRLRFDHLALDGASLELRRDPLGRVFVAGLPLEPGGTDSADAEVTSGATDWLFSQRQVVVSNATLRWVDEARIAPPLALRDVRLVIRNTLVHHDLQVDATPPDTWGASFTVRGRFVQPLFAAPGDWRRWDGTLFTDLPFADVAELRQHVALPIEVREGRGGVRAWLELREGRAAEATLDLALEGLDVRLAPTVEPLEFSRVDGRLVARRSPGGIQLEAHQFGFVTGDGVRWPRGNVAVSWQQQQSGPLGGAGQPVTGGRFSADRLDLDVISQIASRVPLGDAVHRLLATLRPEGVITGLAGQWDGPPDAPWRYQVRGEAAGVTMSSADAPDPATAALARPGLRNAALVFTADERGGQAQVRLQDGSLTFPGLFDEPEIPLRELDARLFWKVDPIEIADAPPRVSVEARGVRFANADARGSLDFKWHSGAGSGHRSGGRWPGIIELEARLDAARLDRVARYLPRHLPAASRDYLRHSLRAGEITAATALIRGDLWDFPYAPLHRAAAAAVPAAAAPGEFRIDARVRGATFAFVPDWPASAGAPAHASPWPAMTDVQAEVRIDRSALAIREGRARIGAVELDEVQGTIADLAEPVLEIGGRGRGALQDMLRFVAATPVREWTHGALDPVTATGAAELRLALGLPLANLDASTVRGSVDLDGNDLRLHPDLPGVAAARGRIEFSERGLVVPGVSVQVAGGEATVEGGSMPDGRLRFTATGTATSDGLRQLRELGPAAALAESLSGQAPYRLQLTTHPEGLDWSFTTTMAGMASRLPPPLDKPADAPMPVRISVTALTSEASLPVAAGDGLRDQLRIDIGERAQLRYLREHRGASTRVLQGGIGVGEPPPEGGDGVAARVRVAALNLDAWQSLRPRLDAATSAGDGATAPAPYAPTRVTLRADELRLAGRRLTAVDLQAAQRQGLWHVDLTADQVAGHVEWGSDAAGDRLKARLARLDLPATEVAPVEQLLESAPQGMPALDVVVDDFVLRERRLGRLEILAQNRVAGDGRREWQLSKLSMSNPDARLSASGIWAVPAAAPGRASGRRTSLDFRLDIEDSGNLLERLGSGRVIRGGQGVLEGQVAWEGTPFDPRFAAMSGQMSLNVDRGQFLKVDPGGSRLLGVLSLQALPRRLALDFRDLFQEGFAFDEVTGDMRVEQGVARTNNLRMRGVQAAVLMEGSADLRTETQDVRVVVVPEINAGTASLAYAAINPAIGLGTFLAQYFLRKPLAEAGTREFRITGPWSDPKVERVERAERRDAAASRPAQ